MNYPIILTLCTNAITIILMYTCCEWYLRIPLFNNIILKDFDCPPLTVSVALSCLVFHLFSYSLLLPPSLSLSLFSLSLSLSLLPLSLSHSLSLPPPLSLLPFSSSFRCYKQVCVSHSHSPLNALNHFNCTQTSRD